MRCLLPKGVCCEVSVFAYNSRLFRTARVLPSGVSNAPNLRCHRQEADERSFGLAREQQDHPHLPAQPALPPLLARAREPLGAPARLDLGTTPHRQARPGGRAGRDQGEEKGKGESLRSPTCAKKSISNPRPAPATSTPPPRTSAPSRRRSK